MVIEIDYYITMVSKIMRTINPKRTLSAFKNKSAEVLQNPFPKK